MPTTLVPHLGSLAEVVGLLEVEQSAVQRLPQRLLLLLNQEVVEEEGIVNARLLL